MSRKALGRGLSALFTQTNPLDQDLVYIDVDQLEPSETQPRKLFNENKLKELAGSIKTNGIIQPIVVRRNGERFQIIAGERRWRAAQIAGLHKLPCVIRNVPEEGILELSLIENIQREELNPIEEATAYKRLLEKLNTTQEELAQRVGKDRSTITNSLRLLKLPPEVQILVEEEKLSMGHARALLAVDSLDQQKTLALEIVTRALSVRETEKLVKRTQQRIAESPKIENRPENDDANLRAAESKLSKNLGTPVHIRIKKQGKGIIEIKFSSTEDLMRLFDLLIQKQSV
ncbi:MAG TPA: ParB/RepB/Spo0J family partition protein [Blastocatellia bacterium]|nr:ParB/RepB/Spo0J family partition protein [Blastocatellia bacterium]